MVAGTLVNEYGTAFVRTRILDLGDGEFAWLRTPGPEFKRTSVQLTSRLVETVHKANDGDIRFLLPKRHDGAMLYILPRSFSAARLLHSSDEARDDLLVTAMCEAGKALRRLHRQKVPKWVVDPPPGPARLAKWLNRGSGGGGAAELYRFLSRRIGRRRLNLVRDWCENPGRSQTSRCLLHGGPGLGRLIPPAGRRPGGMLVEERLARGSASFDLGWLLGELTELDAAAARGLGSAPDADYRAAAAALVRSYGGEVESHIIGRAAALRMITHLHDFAAFVGWRDDLRNYGGLIADVVDGEGAQALRLCAQNQDQRRGGERDD